MKKPNDTKRDNSTDSHADFVRSRERYIHTSAHIVRNPLAAIAELQNRVYLGPQFIVHRPGTTLRTGRNAQKRNKRALMTHIAGSVRTYRKIAHLAGARRAA